MKKEQKQMLSKDQANPFKVIILGGGLVGSLASLYFANRGFQVTIYEKRVDPRSNKESQGGKSINLALSTRGIEALKMAQIFDKVEKFLIPMKGRMLHSLNGSLSAQAYGTFGQCINSVDRNWINCLLLDEVSKKSFAKLVFGHAVTRVDFEKGTVILRDGNGKQVFDKADLIIGADGAYSSTRQQMMRSERINYMQHYIEHGYVELRMPPTKEGGYAMDPNHLHIWPRQTFMMIALPNQDCSFTVTLFMPFSKFEAIKTTSQLISFFETTFPDSIAPMGLENLVDDYFANPKGPLISIKCSPYNVGCGVIVGDAAHAMVPFYGQGMNCGFEDILVLNEVFDSHPGELTRERVELILKDYTSLRNPDAEAMCDLALHNYEEMRSSVTKTSYLVRKKIEGALHYFMPKTFMPLYTMVSFSRVRYSVAKKSYERGTIWFTCTFVMEKLPEIKEPPVSQPLTACEYKTGKTLGQGSYATVKEAVQIKTGKKFAVKMISKKLMRGKEFMILNEIDVLKKISQGHPNIMSLHDYFETPNNLYLVMDLCSGGELFDRICEVGQFYEKDAMKIIKTVLNSIRYLHNLNVVHRDIKPENLIFKDRTPDSTLLIADFGLSKYIDDKTDQSLRTTCGTPGYMAPEVVQKLGHGKPVDMWSIGIMTYFLLCGYMPFETEHELVDVERAVRAQFTFDEKYWCDISPFAKDFIRKLLVVDPKKRMTIDEAMQHDWIADPPPVPPKDLFPNVRKGFNAKKTFRKVVEVVKAVNKLSHSRSQNSLASSHGDDDERNRSSHSNHAPTHSGFLTVENPLNLLHSPMALSTHDMGVHYTAVDENDKLP